MLGFAFSWPQSPPSNRKLVTLPDGDQISLEITTPPTWRPERPTVVLVHGLCGSHSSPYLVRLAKRLYAEGIRAVRMNMRGCGSGKGLAKQIYHGGRSEDILAVLTALKKDGSPITLIGYSLGGNTVLKLAGEWNGDPILHKVIAVNPPVDLLASIEMFNRPENTLYERRFCYEMRLIALEYGAILPKGLRIVEFDERFTAPRGGFKSAHDYYTRCSSAPLVPKIKIPTQILFAKDDPLVAHHSLDHVELPSNVKVVKTEKGGHLGFLGHPLEPGGFRWLDSQLIDWIL